MRGREREENKENINEDGTETTFSHSLSLLTSLSFSFFIKTPQIAFATTKGFFQV